MATFRFSMPRLPRLRLPRLPGIVAWVERKHWRRYVLGWGVSVVGVAVLGTGYMMFWPKSYTSEMTLILPGAGAGANVSVQSIGQASSIVSSPFGQSSLSPKVIYKQIAESDQVLGMAAESLGLEAKEFGQPRIKMVDLTAVLLFEVRGASPELARDKAKALLAALDKQLDSLRRDEIDKRAGAVQASLVDYRASLDQARRRVLEFQQSTGLVSLAQFSDLTTTLEQTKRKLIELRGEVARLESQQGSLATELGMSADEAVKAMTLAADPSFVRVVRDLADARLQFADRSSRLGTGHPQVIRERARRDQLLGSTQAMLHRAGLADADRAIDIVSTIDTPTRAELVQQLVRGRAELLGKKRQLADLEGEATAAQRAVERFSPAAAGLEDLQKKQLVAEAVYSSAVARIDTNRADVYASYPLVQVLAEPSLPERPSSPRLLFAAIGVFGGLVLATAAWVMAWLYQLFVLRRSKSA